MNLQYSSSDHGFKGYDFPAALRKAMELTGCANVADLSKLTGVACSSLNRIVLGNGYPSWITACQIINSFSFSLEFWFNGGNV